MEWKACGFIAVDRLTELITGTHITQTRHIVDVASPLTSQIEGRSTMRTDNIVRFRSLDKARPTNRLN
jgi:hypothetical protein